MENVNDNTVKRTNHPGTWPGRIIAWVITGIVGAVVLAFLFGYFVMLLWNWLMPDLFGLGIITYWQAFGIVLLARLVFGGIGNHHHDHHKKDKWEHFRKYHDRKNSRKCNGDYTKWKYYDEYWNEEGEKSFDDYIERRSGEKKTE
ncbi:MAG: hypothetical protein ABIJ16_09905 [Bacteroidota bacterium]